MVCCLQRFNSVMPFSAPFCHFRRQKYVQAVRSFATGQCCSFVTSRTPERDNHLVEVLYCAVLLRKLQSGRHRAECPLTHSSRVSVSCHTGLSFPATTVCRRQGVSEDCVTGGCSEYQVVFNVTSHFVTCSFLERDRSSRSRAHAMGQTEERVPLVAPTIPGENVRAQPTGHVAMAVQDAPEGGQRDWDGHLLACCGNCDPNGLSTFAYVKYCTPCAWGYVLLIKSSSCLSSSN